MTEIKHGHESVLSSEAVNFWHTKPGGLYVDATLGMGGHSEALLAHDPKAQVIGLDVDPQALEISKRRLQDYGSRIKFIKENYVNLGSVLQNQNTPMVDGVLADFGVSSIQLDQSERGFSFKNKGPLDMRMDPTQGETALELIENSTEKELTQILRQYGEERKASLIARRLKEAQSKGKLNNTHSAAQIIASIYSREDQNRSKIHPATRSFQALRIAVNHELDHIDQFLTQTPQFISQGGRMVCISFHSLEDRRVKESFNNLSKGCICPPDFPKCACGKTGEFKVITRKPVVSNENERNINVRSRSAKMRALEKI